MDVDWGVVGVVIFAYVLGVAQTIAVFWHGEQRRRRDRQRGSTRVGGRGDR